MLRGEAHGAGARGDGLLPDAPRRLKGGWFEQRSGRGYVLSRQWPPRFDVQVRAEFLPAAAALRRGRLARQIRQDLWRALRGLRGFSPVIQIDTGDHGLAITAGGRLLDGAPKPGGAEAKIAALLEDPAHLARWFAWAQERAA